MNSFNDSRFFGKCLSVFDTIGALSKSEADELYNYMLNSIEVSEFLSSEPDIVNNQYLIPTKIFTDGTYEWTMMIPYLVKKYRVALPNEFVEHIKKQKILPNQKNKKEIDEIIEFFEKNKNIEIIGF